MTLKEFASLLDGREYRCEITPSEEALAKELGFVVVFGYSDDNAELRGAIDDEISCYDGGVLEHKDLPSTIYADWCPKDLDCAWAYSTSIPHEKFEIYDHGTGGQKMANEKCCYDCVFCVTDNSPIEVGLQYACFLQKGDRIDPWNTPCKYFVEGKEDGK